MNCNNKPLKLLFITQVEKLSHFYVFSKSAFLFCQGAQIERSSSNVIHIEYQIKLKFLQLILTGNWSGLCLMMLIAKVFKPKKMIKQTCKLNNFRTSGSLWSAPVEA